MIATEAEIVDLKIVLFKIVNNGGLCKICGDALDVVPSAKLAITTTAHQEQIALCRKQTCVTTSAPDFFHSTIELHLFGSI